jgi:hypothetical protein
VLRIHDDETGLGVDLEPEQVPITQPIPADALVYESHPTGWHAPAVVRRRGYPLHHMHTHKTERDAT